jgi:glycosyltransferase involved in cell wall biosynthesis
MTNKPLPKISVIIPTLNEEENLSACLDSLTSVDYPREFFEMIVVDNGSTDKTREIAEAYATTVLLQPSGNVAALRNLGAREATGQILAFVDGDCVVDRDWLRNAAIYFDDADVVAWGGPPALPENSTWVQKTWFLVRQKQNQIQEVDWLESMNLFVRRHVFWQVNGFAENLVTCEDVDFCYRLGKLGRIMSDRNIKIIHLGEAATIRKFIHKEVWRGKSNWSGILSHGLSIRELPSLSIPVYFSLLIPLLMISILITGSVPWLFTLLILYLLPTILVLIKVIRKRLQPGFLDLLRLSALLQIYFWARTVTILKSGART